MRRQAQREAALQVPVGVERGECALLRRECDGRGIGLVAHRFGDLGAEGITFGRVVAHAHHHERAAQTQEPQADAALEHRLTALLFQRPVGDLQHVVEHAHRGADHRLEGIPVEPADGLERRHDKPRQVDRAEAAAPVVGQALLAAGIGGLDHLHVLEVVLLVHAIQEHDAGVGVVVGRADDLVHQGARTNRAVNPLAVDGALSGAGFEQRARGLGVVDQFELGVGLDGLHERVGHADRDVEVGQAVAVLAVHELEHVRVVAAQDAHLRAAPRAGRLDRLAVGVEDAHEAHRPGGAGVRALDHRAPGADAREVVADATAAAKRFGRLPERLGDAGLAVEILGHRVADRLHEAVDQRRTDIGAAGGVDASGGNEAALHGREELGCEALAIGGRFHFGQSTSHPPADVVGVGFAALGVLLDKHVAGDGLRKKC